MSWFSRLLGEFTHASGIFPPPLHDFDLFDEPSAVEAPAIASADASPRLGPCVDGPAAQGGEASAAGHPNVDWGVVREGMAELRAVLVDALAWIDEVDPTAAGLAEAARPPSYEVMSIEEFQKRLEKRRR